MTTDKNGRTYAKLSDVKPCDVLEADGGFDCLKPRQLEIVKVKENGSLYIDCSYDGGHILDGQLDDEGYLIGLYPAV